MPVVRAQAEGGLAVDDAEIDSFGVGALRGGDLVGGNVIDLGSNKAVDILFRMKGLQ